MSDIENMIKAISLNDMDAVKKYVNDGGDLNALGSQGYTPLMMAVIKSSEEIVSFLLEHDADPDIKSRDAGFTATHFAIDGNKFDLATTLINSGADVNAIDDKYGNNIIGFAVNNSPVRKPVNGVAPIFCTRGYETG